MSPPLAVITHLGLLTPLLIAGFVVGVCGHVVRSRTLILVGIVVLAVASLYLLGAGEVQTF